MATTERRSSVIVPLWVLIAVGALVIAAISVLVGYSVSQSQPSEADLLVRVMTGNKEAAETLEARYAEPTLEPISNKDSSFTPGTYKKANSDATDGAEIIASFIFLSSQGQIDEAMKLTTNSSSLELREAANQVLKYASDSAQLKELNRGVVIGELTTIQEELVTETMHIVHGELYMVRIPSLADIGVLIVMDSTGWRIQNFAGYEE